MSGFISSASTEAIAIECAKIEPQQLIVHINNDTTEEEVHEFFSGLEIVLESLESDSLVVYVELSSEEIESLKNDPSVSEISEHRYDGMPLDYIKSAIHFTEQVTDQIAFELLDSIPKRRITSTRSRAPREATITVPEGEEETWLERLVKYPFVIDASRKCYSTYYITCEQYGGTIEGSNFDSERCVDLPLPEINWDEILYDIILQCKKDNGTWTQYRSTCQDECSFVDQDVCGFVVTEGCDCGLDRCSIGENLNTDGRYRKYTCIDNPKWHHKY